MSAWTDHVVGHRYRGPEGTFICTAYAPRSGFWMQPEDPSDKPHNVSERAINRTFHPIDEPDRIVEMRRAGLASMGICATCGDAGKTDGCATCAAHGKDPSR